MAEYPATNNLADLVETNPLGSEEPAKIDDALRETRRVMKTFFQLVFNDDGTLKTDIINAAQIVANAVTAAKLNDDVAGVGLDRNAGTNAIDLLFDSSIFEINGSGQLAITAGAALDPFISGIGNAKITSMDFSKLTHSTTAGKFLISDGTSNFNLFELTGGISVNAADGTVTIEAAVEAFLVVETAPNNSSPGGLTAATWTNRVFAGEQFDTGNDCAVAASEVTLQPGTYVLDIRVPAYRVDGHVAKLQRYDTGSSSWQDVRVGSSSFSDSTNGDTTWSEIFAIVTPALETRYRIQSIGGTTNGTDGLGKAANVGELETYTRFLGYAIGGQSS